MKNTYFILMLVSALFLNACNNKDQTANDNEAQSIEGLYFGLKPPSIIAEPFTPGIGWELGEMHDQNMEEFYFTPSIEVPLRGQRKTIYSSQYARNV